MAYDARPSEGRTAHVLTSEDDLRAAAALDDAAFDGAVGLDHGYLRSIALEHGVVLGLKDGTGRLVAMAQLILNAIPDAPEYLVRSLRTDTAYLEGFAVHPEHTGEVRFPGRAMVLCAERLLALYCPEKRFVACTIHPGNFRSQDTLISGLWFMAVGYDPRYYGEADEGRNGRLVVVKDLVQPPVAVRSRDIRMPLRYRSGKPDWPDVGRARQIARRFDDGLVLTSVEKDPADPSSRFFACFQPLPDPAFRARWLPEPSR